MPFKFKNPYRHKFEPMKYRITNWHDYNQSLKDRGNITIWFDDKAIRRLYAKHNGKPGRQRTYSNLAIETACIIRLVFHLAYRQTEGFMQSITKLMGVDLKIPNYSTLSRRMKKISVKLKTSKHKKGTHIITDGSGLSVHDADTFYKSKVSPHKSHLHSNLPRR